MFKFKKKKDETKDNTLVSDLIQAQSDLELAYANFEVVIEPELIDACIYQVNAVQQKYCFILKQLKKA